MMKIKHTVQLSLFLALTSVAIAPGVADAKDGFYIGVNGGKNWARNGESGTSGAGSGFGAFLSNIDGGSRSNLSGLVGYRFSDLLRVDAAYTRLKNQFTWQGNFADGSTNQFAADTASHVFMLNGAVHAKGIWPESIDKIDPFLSAGVGHYHNSVSHAVETNVGTGAVVSYPADGTHSGMAYRLGFGVDYLLNQNFTLTTSADARWLGDFKTGTHRNTIPATPSMGAWRISDVIAVSASVGLRYSF